MHSHFQYHNKRVPSVKQTRQIFVQNNGCFARNSVCASEGKGRKVSCNMCVYICNVCVLIFVCVWGLRMHGIRFCVCIWGEEEESKLQHVCVCIYIYIYIYIWFCVCWFSFMCVKWGCMARDWREILGGQKERKVSSIMFCICMYICVQLYAYIQFTCEFVRCASTDGCAARGCVYFSAGRKGKWVALGVCMSTCMRMNAVVVYASVFVCVCVCVCVCV
jgi:hypothetical protein